MKEIQIGDIVVDNFNGNIGLITKFHNMLSENGPVPTWFIKIDSSEELIIIADEDMPSEFEIIDHLEETFK